MNIELINTDIDRINTFYFSTDKEKDAFFNQYEVIETTYYPPFYHNEIKLSVSDFNIYNYTDTNFVRYLRINYSGKYYYYFIDRINYINEDVYELDISMDTYMTFMNDIELDNVCIERKFINRWNDDGTINRDYIRENVSHMNMKLLERKILDFKTSLDATDGVIIFKATDRLDKDETCFQTCFRYGSKFVPTSFYYYALPFSQSILSENTFDIQQNNNGTWEVRDKDKEFHITLNYITSRPEVIEAYIVPASLFRDYFFIVGTHIRMGTQALKDGTIVDLNNADIKPVGNNAADTINSHVFIFGFKSHVIIPINFSNTISFPVQENTAKGTSFDKRYLPVLMDSNYYRISYGDRNTQCTDLLEYRTSPKITLYFEPHVDGSRYYLINTDEYYQSVSTTDKFYLPLLKDEWMNYNAYNSASIGMALGNYALGAFGFAYGVGNSLPMSPSALESEMMETYDYSQFLDKRFKSGTMLNREGARRVASYERSIKASELEYQKAQSSASTRAVGQASSLAGTANSEYNAWLAPNGVRSNYDIDTIFMGKAMEISYSWYAVENIEQVAQFYHRQGYLVNEWINTTIGTKYLIDYISTRYYYNVVKLLSCEVKGGIRALPDDICNDIAYRFSRGLRIWNKDENNVNDYRNDNVEVKYL